MPAATALCAMEMARAARRTDAMTTPFRFAAQRRHLILAGEERRRQLLHHTMGVAVRALRTSALRDGPISFGAVKSAVLRPHRTHRAGSRDQIRASRVSARRPPFPMSAMLFRVPRDGLVAACARAVTPGSSPCPSRRQDGSSAARSCGFGANRATTTATARRSDDRARPDLQLCGRGACDHAGGALRQPRIPVSNAARASGLADAASPARGTRIDNAQSCRMPTVAARAIATAPASWGA